MAKAKQKSIKTYICPYLVNDNYWVVATDKKQAGSLVSDAYGDQIREIEIIQLNEVLDNGQPAFSLLDLAQGHAKIIACTHSKEVI